MSVAKYIRKGEYINPRMGRDAAIHDCTPYDRSSREYRIGSAQLRAWRRECEIKRRLKAIGGGR